jgi:outer membrane protein
MKKIIIALLMFLPFTVMAQGNLKIGIFNSQEVITIMPEYNAAMSELEKMNLTFQTEAKKLQEEFEKKYQEYATTAETLDPTIRQYKETELARLQQSIQEFATNAENNIKKKNQELMMPIVNKIQQAIKKVGDENSYTYIIDNAANIVPYISPSADNVLPLIKKALNIQ